MARDVPSAESSQNKIPKLNIMMLHSDVIGNENEDVIETPEDDGRLVVLSTVIGARSITVDRLKYAILHPHVRSSSLHPTGISRIQDVLVSAELSGNMAGRVARASDGLVTFLKLDKDLLDVASPSVESAVQRPPSSAAGNCAAAGQEPPELENSDQDPRILLQHLDEYWAVKQWRKHSA